MMRSSNRLMSFPAGTMITVKGYPFVLRDAAAVMGTPENFGEAMCELAKAEQMQDQAMDSVKMVVELTREAVEAAKKLFPAKGEIAATPDYMVPTWSNAPERKPDDAQLFMHFPDALAELQLGQRIARSAWVDSWLSMSCDGSREVAAENFWSPHNKQFAAENGGKAAVMPSITMQVNGEIMMGWTPSQLEMFARDWIVL